MLRLALLSGEGGYERHALGVLRLLFPLASRHPLAFTHLLRAADFYLAPVREVAIVGPPAEAEPLLRVVRQGFRPHLVLAAGTGDGAAGAEGGAADEGRGAAGVSDGVPLLRGREAVEGHAAAYVCEHFMCRAPVRTPEELAAQLT